MSKKKFILNYNVYGTIEVEAKNEEEVKEIAAKFTREELMDSLGEAVDNYAFEAGTIEEI